LGINQACSEATHQLRIGHLYQLRKDQKSFHQKVAAVAIFLVTLIPSLSSFIAVPILKVGWIITVIALASLYLLSARDKLLKKEAQKDYEDVEVLDRIVRSSQVNLLRDYVFGYCNRHEILYQLHPKADDFEKVNILNVLTSYQSVFKKVTQDVTDLRQTEPRLLTAEDHDAILGDIDFCEKRYAKLKPPTREEKEA
jgi:hypothetical protein